MSTAKARCARFALLALLVVAGAMVALGGSTVVRAAGPSDVRDVIPSDGSGDQVCYWKYDWPQGGYTLATERWVDTLPPSKTYRSAWRVVPPNSSTNTIYIGTRWTTAYVETYRGSWSTDGLWHYSSSSTNEDVQRFTQIEGNGGGYKYSMEQLAGTSCS